MDFEAIRRKRRLYFASRPGRRVDPDLAFTKLLLGFQGANGSTTVTDESPANKGALAVTGNAQISTAQAKFGTSSALFDGTGDRMSLGYDLDFEFDADPFGVDFWVYTASNTGARWFVGKAAGTDAADRFTSSWVFYSYLGVPELAFVNGGAWISVIATTTLTVNTWTHLATDRDDTGKIRLYVNGVMEASRTASTSFQTYNPMGLYIGEPGDFGTGDYAGHLAELRIVKGRAPWASDSGFTPPTAPYARS